MKDFILFMHNDATDAALADDGERWGQYFSSLQASGCFEGGSSIGPGMFFRKGQTERPSTPDLNGFIRVRAEGLDAARTFLSGNPVYEAGGTVEIRELPADG